MRESLLRLEPRLGIIKASPSLARPPRFLRVPDEQTSWGLNDIGRGHRIQSNLCTGLSQVKAGGWGTEGEVKTWTHLPTLRKLGNYATAEPEEEELGMQACLLSCDSDMVRARLPRG